MNNSSFETELRSRIRDTEAIVVRYLPEETGYNRTVLRAMNYAVRAGGKRLRPLLMRETYHLFCPEEGEALYRFMAAIEMIHTYSLIHDDLPALDNDDYRRGRKTTHLVFGEDMAILAGDGLLNYAFEVAAGAFRLAEPGLARVGRAMETLAAKPGIYGMIGGQTADVELTGKEMTLEQLQYIHEHKTGALIECAMMVGAILGGASEEQIRTAEAAASKIGMAFQIQDDILDVTATEETLGKPVRSDEKNQKVTYVTFMGMERAARDVRELSSEAVSLLESLGGENGFLIALTDHLTRRDR